MAQAAGCDAAKRKGNVRMKVDKSLLSGSTTLLVLSLLKDGDMYGYEMISELSRRSDKTFEMKEGTLYPILHGLEKDKCVTVYEKQAPSGRTRKYYHITPKGLEMLERKREEWRLFADKVNGVVFGETPALA
jgi:PadR family transcriptional regulator PadR